MQRPAPRPLRFVLALGFFAGMTFVHAAPPPPKPPDETYTKQRDPAVNPAKEKTLYTVGYAHLDTQWRWTYPQVVRDYLADTLHSNFKLFEKYPNYVFNFSGSRRYEMMREYYPEDYQRLKEYVGAGRWFPCGSSVDECDANVPNLESFVRQMLYGNHFFRQEFGKDSSEFMLPDCFGFPASLPTMLSHSGIKGFSTQKLTWGSANGIPFKVGRWIGPDGSSVVASLDPGGYGGGISEDLSRSQGWLQRINHTGEASGAFVDYHYYGTGDRGGAPEDDAVHWLEHSIIGGGPLRVVSATAERMFNDVTKEQAAKLPTYTGELLLTEHSAGSITSQAYMKRWNRKNELLADAAERASVAATLLGGAPYPTRKLYEGWDLLLGSQMHDMLPGTSLPKAYEYCWNDEILAANHFAAAESDGVGTVASAMETSVKEAGRVPLVVYNPLAQERDDLVEATVSFPEGAPMRGGSATVYRPDGGSVAAQVLATHGQQATLLFPAHLPSVGFASYEVGPPSEAGGGNTTLRISAKGLENARYRVAINDGGDISSIFDKKNNEELLAAPARLEFHYEKPRSFPAWNMDWEDRQKPAAGYVEGPAKVRVAENGQARVALEVVREARGSRFVQTIRLADGPAGDRVEIANVIDWQTPEVSLKAAFPLANANPVASYDDKVGVVTRGNNDPKKYEVPQHQWFDLTGADGRYGVAVLNDSKFGSDKPDDQTMRLTLLYTPGVRGDYQDQASQDFGRHEILYAVTGHKGDWRGGGVSAQAARLNQPLAAFQTVAHPGKLGREFSLLRVKSEQIEVVAIKKAEDSDEIVVRLKELTGRAAEGVEIAGVSPIAAAREINGQEAPLGGATVRDGALVTSLKPFGLRAFAVKFGALATQADPVRSQVVRLPYDLDAVSSQKNRADGGFDHDNVTYPAEQFPKRLQSEGVDFQLGPTGDGQKNAVACRGQTIELPEGDYNRVYLLAAAYDGAVSGAFKIGDREARRTVQDWSAFVGQWDNRLWKGNVPELTYSWRNELDGLAPGFTKRDTVAWYASHRHHPQKGNEFYQYCYLFKYGFDVPAGARRITLPNEPRIGVFAVTVAANPHDNVLAANPPYDTMEHVSDGAPTAQPAAGQFGDSTLVTLVHPLYWQAGGLHYTTDGSEPTASSAVYAKPFWLHTASTVRSRMIWPDGRTGAELTARYDIRDSTPPKLVSASALDTVAQIELRFSEPLDKAAAENPANYQLEPGTPVRFAQVSADGRGVTLNLERKQPGNVTERISVTGVKDQAPGPNASDPKPVKVTTVAKAYALDSFVATGAESKKITVEKLPTGAKAPWTVNLFVRADKQPENRTIIAGFGTVKDEDGHGRYLSKFANGIHFWSADQDVETNAPLALGKWQMLTATYDGSLLTVYQDGKQVGEGAITLADDQSVIEIAPLDPWDHERRFVGEIREFTVWNSVLDQSAIRTLRERQP